MLPDLAQTGTTWTGIYIWSSQNEVRDLNMFMTWVMTCNYVLKHMINSCSPRLTHKSRGSECCIYWGSHWRNATVRTTRAHIFKCVHQKTKLPSILIQQFSARRKKRSSTHQLDKRLDNTTQLGSTHLSFIRLISASRLDSAWLDCSRLISTRLCIQQQHIFCTSFSSKSTFIWLNFK